MKKMKNKTKKIFSVVIASILLLSVSAVAVSVIGADNPLTLDQEKINQLGEVSQSGELGIWSVIYTDVWSVSATDECHTASLSFVDMPNTSINITTYLPTDLVIMFSSECVIWGADTLYIRCLVDGEEAKPGPITLRNYEAYTLLDDHQSRAFNFYVKELPAGEHTIAMQWKLDEPMGMGTVWARALNVIANGAGHL